MKALIIYYSSTGNTEEASTVLEKCLCEKDVDCKRIKIISAEQKTSFISKIVRSLSGKPETIKCCTFNPDDYDFIFLGTPVWAAKPTPSLTAFLNEMPKLHGQKVCPFVTMGGMGDKATIANIKKKVEAKGGCFHASLSLKMDKGIGDEHINSIENFVRTRIVENKTELH